MPENNSSLNNRKVPPLPRNSSIWQWLAKNWEPITAICALLVGVASGWQSYQGIKLAREGIAVAHQAQIDQSISSRISRAPFVIFKYDAIAGELSIANLGEGTAYIYQFDASFGGRTATLTAGQNAMGMSSDLFSIFTAAATASTFSLTMDSSSLLSTPIGLLSSGEQRVIFKARFHGSPTGSTSEFPKFVASIDMRICSTDLIGEKRYKNFNGTTPLATDCAPAPNLLNM
ncbi:MULTISPECIES: hypothetical protein [unclassified Mesorhizobium]|uniref:hypothetical protein n=1 Tax=unclassified Mesorhizobium TaxID=325217 RepID=UPI00116C401C|nr:MULTISPECIES: hypothetical protein [unclassified Mesorhizobium]MBZ9998548.1 hypothetical protein [Mesorhizobium sp. B264B2A]MCA0005093.1 hypothetical protein [Mesorhizobium sp. B264B1B]MCA0019727.1 hypothetical protein [Mesorhizobium sp. B264B1A]TPJ45698.1 hypothetical protein FJ437_15840 [Mesorhizobium sp. B2-6-6]